MSTKRGVAVAVLLLFASPLFAATFTVTNGSQTGPGTLTQAILDANATPGRDQIRFAVSASVIPETGIPAVTDAVDIDGLLADGNRVLIFTPFGTFDTTAGFKFRIGSSTSTLANVVMGLPGDFINGAAVSTELGANGIRVTNGVFLGNLSVSSDDNVFEANIVPNRNLTLVVDGNRNVFSGNTLPRVLLSFGDSNRFEDNTITWLESSSTRLTVEGNLFATAGEAFAIQIYGPQPAPTVIAGNTIQNYVRGVLVFGAATGVTITGNSIFNTTFPIDLGFDGPTPNDPAPDADTGPNNRQNFPILTSATLTGGSLVVTGTLTSTPLLTYLVELFADNAADPEARTLLASFDVTADATGTATFTRTVTTPLPTADQVVTSTATTRLTGDTSEVSAAVAINAPGTVGFSAATYSVNETDGTATVTVNRTGGSEGTVTVQYATSPGSATTPADFTATSGTLTFGPGVTSQSFNVPIVADTIPEGEEAFTVNLTNATGGAVLGTATATVVIASHLPTEAIPTASTWGLIILAASLALIALTARPHS